MARSAKIVQSFISRHLKLPYTCRENLTQSQISDFFSLNLTILTNFGRKVRLSDLGQINLTTLSTLYFEK